MWLIVIRVLSGVVGIATGIGLVYAFVRLMAYEPLLFFIYVIAFTFPIVGVVLLLIFSFRKWEDV